MEAIQRALEAAGVEFTNGDQPRVRPTPAAATQLQVAISLHIRFPCVAYREGRERGQFTWSPKTAHVVE